LASAVDASGDNAFESVGIDPQGSSFGELFLVFFFVVFAFGAALDAAPDLAGAFLSAADFASLAANRTGVLAGFGFAVVAAAVSAAAPAGFALAVFAAPAPLPLAFLRPHLPKVRGGAAASRVWHSSNVRLFGSLSLGIFALRALSVM